MQDLLAYIASDHAGFELKAKICQALAKNQIPHLDLGTHSPEPCDYADWANLLAEKMLGAGGTGGSGAGTGEAGAGRTFGILICGTGVGMSIAANRHPQLRCALCSEPLTARLAREHNDANVLALGGRLIGPALGIELVKTFLAAKFQGGRHLARVAKLDGAGGAAACADGIAAGSPEAVAAGSPEAVAGRGDVAEVKISCKAGPR